MPEPLLTPAEIAEQCQLSIKTVIRAIRSGRLRACRLGPRGGYRVAPADLDAWIAASVVEPQMHRVPAPPTPIHVAVPGSSAVGRLVVSPEMGRATASRQPGTLGHQL
jgi:excisionase family DNA binding protein